MMKKIFLSLCTIIGVLVLTGCIKPQEVLQEKKVEPNVSMGWISVYVPIEFEYRADLRGLIYSEDERRIFVKGDPQDRSTAVIVDLIKVETDDNIKDYVEKVDSNIEVKYKKIKEDPIVYLRNKYEGKSGDTVIYNYTYLTNYNDYIYSITVSGPQDKETELNKIKDDILVSLKVGN